MSSRRGSSSGGAWNLVLAILLLLQIAGVVAVLAGVLALASCSPVQGNQPWPVGFSDPGKEVDLEKCKARETPGKVICADYWM